MEKSPKIVPIQPPDGKKQYPDIAFTDINSVYAICPITGKKIILKVSKNFMKTIAAGGWRTKLMEAWPLLAGLKPPVNGVGKHEGYKEVELTPLLKAHQLWQGIERPCNDYDNGDDVYVYVTKPMYTYELVYDYCMARRIPVPEDEVLTIFVRFEEDWEKINDEGSKGTIIGWRFFKTEKDDNMTPVEASTRYNKRIW